MLKHKLQVGGTGTNPWVLVSVLSVALALLTTLVLGLWMRSETRKPTAHTTTTPQDQLYIPPLDQAALDAAVRDASAEQRALLGREGLELLSKTARLYTPAHFDQLGAREVDAQVLEALRSQPSELRGKAFVARGWIAALRSRRTSLDGPEEHLARVELENGGTLWAIVLDLPRDRALALDDFVRADGLFLQNYREESGREWYEGPLLVTPELLPSSPALPPAPRELTAATLLEIQDDDARQGVGQLPYGPFWECMAWVAARASEQESDVDWALATELDSKQLAALRSDPGSARMQPFRAVAYVLTTSVQRLEENPARLREQTEGWLGSQQWNDGELVHFKAPFALRDIPSGAEVEVQGWFFKRWAYESAGMGVVEAPIFLLHSMRVFQVPPERGLTVLSVIITVIVLGLLVLFALLAHRDRRSSEALDRQRKRLRERRGLSAANPQARA